MNKTIIYNLTYDMLLDVVLQNNYKKYRADQIWDFLYVKLVDSFDKMSNLPQDLISFLNNNYYFGVFDLIFKNESTDKTLKFLYGLEDLSLIECVLMNHNYGQSICVTTQVGCSIGCSFCASGLLKKKRDLQTGEIVGQIIQVSRNTNRKISSVVVMGIGEPFDNFENIKNFISIINNQKGLNIGARRITVSTSGIVPKIYEFADLKLQVNLAISLHAPFNDKRSDLMKINKTYPIEKVVKALKYYLEKTNRRVTIEYILINELNDNKEDALELVRLFKGLNVYFNLIPYNEVKEAPYKRSEKYRQLKFLDYLKQNKMDAILRKEQGHDINAACGQLRANNITDEK